MTVDVQMKRILLVEDEESTRVLLKGILQRAGFTQVAALEDPRKTVERFLSYRPDLIIIDYHMPLMTGLQAIELLRPHLPEYFPILMLTADERPELRQTALASGAKDFLTKPVNAIEVELRIRNLLEARHFHSLLEEQNERLEEMVMARTEQLEHAQIEMLVRLAKAAEFRDDESGEHVWRVAHTSAAIAREMGMDEDEVNLLLRAARLHDVGKIGIPDGILLKPTLVTDAEFAVIKTHTEIGADLLSGGRTPLMQMAEVIARTHHERWDGTGYPNGLKGAAIPLVGRILAVADTFDALTHDRIHRRAVTIQEAVDEIVAHRGRQFDPEVVDAFLAIEARGELITEPLPGGLS
jgi:putative two-component system response regulator